MHCRESPATSNCCWYEEQPLGKRIAQNNAGNRICTLAESHALAHTHTCTRRHAATNTFPLACTLACVHAQKCTHKCFLYFVLLVWIDSFLKMHTQTRWETETTYKNILICAQCRRGLLLVCPGSEDVNQRTGKSTVVPSQRLQAGRSQMCDIWSACGLDQLQGSTPNGLFDW